MEEQQYYYTDDLKEKLMQYVYYILIGIVSILALVFLPMIGSDLSGGFQWPKTTMAWCIYIGSKVSVALINIISFHAFVQQAKINVRDNENYKRAKEILGKYKPKEYHPRSPKVFNGQQYGSKGIGVVISSILATFVFTEAILRFDWVVMLAYLFTVTLNIVFGIMTMLKNQTYWTTEYLDYALQVQAQKELEHDNDNEERKNDNAEEPSRASELPLTDSSGVGASQQS